MTTAIPTPLSLSRPTAPLPPAAEQVIGFRIMRQTEVGPGWWGQPSEVGETVSGTVAYNFCAEQNAVTMDANRVKRIMFYADPIYAEVPAVDATPTAPLPPAAVAALLRLERAFLPMPLDMVRAVTRYEIATARYDELVARPASELSPGEVDAIGDAQQAIADAFGVLAEAGRLDLIAPAETAARYRVAASHCARLAADPHYVGIEQCLDLQDEMAMCRCRLERAGRLDLIGVA